MPFAPGVTAILLLIPASVKSFGENIFGAALTGAGALRIVREEALADVLDSNDVDAQAAALGALIERVELLPDRYLRIVPHWGEAELFRRLRRYGGGRIALDDVRATE